MRVGVPKIKKKKTKNLNLCSESCKNRINSIISRQNTSKEKKSIFHKIVGRRRRRAGFNDRNKKKSADRNQKFANRAENLVWLEYKCKYDDISKWHNNTRIRRDVARTRQRPQPSRFCNTHTHTHVEKDIYYENTQLAPQITYTALSKRAHNCVRKKSIGDR